MTCEKQPQKTFNYLEKSQRSGKTVIKKLKEIKSNIYDNLWKIECHAESGTKYKSQQNSEKPGKKEIWKN